jgi:site-specific DNA-methyltransferase (adenine-specific)
MKFDVIVGNPPYQLSDGGGMGTSAIPLYQKFVQQAKKLKPRYLSMIIPSRWYSGGKGLDDFRSEMLHDRHVRHITDYFDPSECFPGIDLSGGVCYFLWDRDSEGLCEVETIRGGEKTILTRELLEEKSDTFIRFNEAVSIIRKINMKHEASFDTIVSTRKPFGFDSAIKIKNTEFTDSVRIFSYPNDGYIGKDKIRKNPEWVDKYKVLIAKAYGERGNFPYSILARPFIGGKGTCCSETYLVIGPCRNRSEAEHIVSYIITKFFRFLVLLKKNTQNAPKNVYSFVPMQDFSESWTDEKLYKKYGLTKDEIAFIESMVKTMEIGEEK